MDDKVKGGKYVVLDATPVIVSPSVPRGLRAAVTTPSVVEELLRTTWEIQEVKVRALLESGSLAVLQPSDAFVERVRGSMSKDERTSASKADVEVLALALQLLAEGNDVVLLSDDSVVRRVAARLGIPCKGVKYPQRDRT
ncbi:MAG: PIN domain-containing protein [Candidatus Caldarchaeales archaeon]